jgi:hypothetical protein
VVVNTSCCGYLGEAGSAAEAFILRVRIGAARNILETLKYFKCAFNHFKMI